MSRGYKLCKQNQKLHSPHLMQWTTQFWRKKEHGRSKSRPRLHFQKRQLVTFSTHVGPLRNAARHCSEHKFSYGLQISKFVNFVTLHIVAPCFCVFDEKQP